MADTPLNPFVQFTVIITGTPSFHRLLSPEQRQDLHNRLRHVVAVSIAEWNTPLSADDGQKHTIVIGGDVN